MLSAIDIEIDWQELLTIVNEVLTNDAIEQQSFFYFLQGLALAHIGDWEASNAVFARLRQSQLPPNVLWLPRAYLLNPRGGRNPNWTRDETILALDRYLSLSGKIPSGKDRRVRQLSDFLRRIPYDAISSRKPSFRNPDGVAFKLQILHQVATGRGLGNVSQTNRHIWRELGQKPEIVKALALTIMNAISTTDSVPTNIDLDFEFVEGRLLTELHVRRERDPRLRKRFLRVLRKDGRLECTMCLHGSFASAGAIEDAAFEIHPLRSLCSTGARITRLNEVVLLCANCHRLLHSAISLSKRWLTIDEAVKVCQVRRVPPSLPRGDPGNTEVLSQ